MRENSEKKLRPAKSAPWRKWTVLALLFAGLAVLGYGLDRFMPSAEQVLGPEVSAAPAQTQTQQKIRVKIEGNVAKPGVYTLPLGARLKDLVDKAGGLSDNYDTTKLPLSMFSELSDGQLVRIP